MIVLFKNPGAGVCVQLEKVRDFHLIASASKNEFIVATYLEENGSWSNGSYFKSLTDAKRYFDEQVKAYE